MPHSVNLNRELKHMIQPWSPRVIARFNGHAIMVVRVEGEFIWHSHAETDHFFLVLSGALTIKTDAGDVDLGTGDRYVVPRGVRHCPIAHVPTELLLIEREGTVHTGDVPVIEPFGT